MENDQEIKFYSVAEVSKMLGISRSRAYEWIVSPQCPFSGTADRQADYYTCK